MSRESSTPSGAPATSSAPTERGAPARGHLAGPFRRLPIRWRLAGGSALLTLIILMAFAVGVGALAGEELRTDFREQINRADALLARELHLHYHRSAGRIVCSGVGLRDFGRAEGAVVDVVLPDGQRLCGNLERRDLGRPRPGQAEVRGYRIESRVVAISPSGAEDFRFTTALARYARPVSEVHQTIQRVWLFLALGVLAAVGLALLAGLAIARRAMSPIAALSETAREIERTRDPGRRVAVPEGRDEIATLARTLDDMLLALDGARGETEAALERQRRFVADASHELRTPLTSVLANLEILAAELDGEPQETASAALRSTNRMRRLVADLLLLARADAGRRVSPQRAVDFARVVTDAAGELGPIATGHELELNTPPQGAPLMGDADELHRLAVNLLENALRHTPPGSRICAEVAVDDGAVLFVVEDDGPGVPPDLAGRIFDRFVTARGDAGGGGTGLGLAIVAAVAESHGGSAVLTAPTAGRGARFEVRLPADLTPRPRPAAASGAA